MSPHNTEVGAGTRTPATFLRALGLEPERCYPESIRPDDSRYGDNLNQCSGTPSSRHLARPRERAGVVPGSSRLSASTRARTTFDSWRITGRAPSRGVGLGWEVWPTDGGDPVHDFQQCGSLKVSPTAVEITHGLERSS